MSSAASAVAAEPAFWQPGQVRELFVSGLPTDDAALSTWAENGVNCVTGVKPEAAHARGPHTRTWFTMTNGGMPGASVPAPPCACQN